MTRNQTEFNTKSLFRYDYKAARTEMKRIIDDAREKIVVARKKAQDAILEFEEDFPDFDNRLYSIREHLRDKKEKIAKMPKGEDKNKATEAHSNEYWEMEGHFIEVGSIEWSHDALGICCNGMNIMESDLIAPIEKLYKRLGGVRPHLSISRKDEWAEERFEITQLAEELGRRLENMIKDVDKHVATIDEAHDKLRQPIADYLEKYAEVPYQTKKRRIGGIEQMRIDRSKKWAEERAAKKANKKRFWKKKAPQPGS